MSDTLPFAFGAGDIFARPLTGNDRTPVKVGAHQGMTQNLKSDIKTLFGQSNIALAAATGKMDTSITFKSAEIDMGKMNALRFGQEVTAGQQVVIQNEVQNVPGTGPYTVSPANLANFEADLGVTYQSTGQRLRLTASTAPATTGTYAINGSNKYVFAPGDSNKPVNLNYLIQDDTQGTTLTITAQPMGTTPQLEIIFTTTYNGQTYTGRFYRAISGSIKLESKVDDFWMGDFDVTCFAGPDGVLCTMSTTASAAA